MKLNRIAGYLSQPDITRQVIKYHAAMLLGRKKQAQRQLMDIFERINPGIAFDTPAFRRKNRILSDAADWLADSFAAECTVPASRSSGGCWRRIQAGAFCIAAYAGLHFREMTTSACCARCMNAFSRSSTSKLAYRRACPFPWQDHRPTASVSTRCRKSENACHRIFRSTRKPATRSSMPTNSGRNLLDGKSIWPSSMACICLNKPCAISSMSRSARPPTD